MSINPYEEQDLNRNDNITYDYIIFRNSPDVDLFGQYIFEPNNLQNQFPGRSPIDESLDLYTHTPSQFFFLPYEYQIRRDITTIDNRRLYISNIAMGISNHKYARTNWTLSYYDSLAEYGDMTMDSVYAYYGDDVDDDAAVDVYYSKFAPLNNGLYVPPMHRDGRLKAEHWEDTSTYGYVEHMHHYEDRKTGSGSERWSGRWTIGNYNPSNESASTNHGSTTLMSPANTSFKGYMRNTHGSAWNSRYGAPLNIQGGDNDYLWRYTQILPLETPCNAKGESPYGALNIEAELVYDEDTDTTYPMTGLEAAGIHDLFTKKYSTDYPSLSGRWYVCVHMEADGWEWKVVNWKPGYYAVNRDRRWECFIVPKQDYVYYWFYLVEGFNLGRATGTSSNPNAYQYEGREYVKHYNKALSYTQTSAEWNSMTTLKEKMAVGSIPPTMKDIRRLGAFSKYHPDFMGWINPEAPHQTLKVDEPFRFYNPFRKDGTDTLYNLLDLTGVTKPDGTPLLMQTHVNAIQNQFRPIVKTTTTTGLVEFQRWYEEGVDNAFELVSAPAEVEFSVDIKSNVSFFPSDEFIIDNVVYTLEDLKNEFGIKYKYFVVDWGDIPNSDNSDGNMDGYGAGDGRVDFPSTITEYNQHANNGRFIVFENDNVQRHTYFEEGLYTITAYVMCVVERDNIDVEGEEVVEDMVIAMKKTETKIRVEKEFIFYPDYLHLGGGDYPIIPWTSGVAPIIGGIAEKSDYKDSLRKVLGASSHLFSNARENFLKGKTRKAYHNDELGSFLTKVDIAQVRYLKTPFDINYLLGLRLASYKAHNIRIKTGICEYYDELTGEYSIINDRIYGDNQAIEFMSQLKSGDNLYITGFNDKQFNNSDIYSSYSEYGHPLEPMLSEKRYFQVDEIGVDDNNEPFISIRGCEVLTENNGDGEYALQTGSNQREIIIEPRNLFKTNILYESIPIPDSYICSRLNTSDYDYECNEGNLGSPCGPVSEYQDTIEGGTPLPSGTQKGICIQDYLETQTWKSYSDTEYWIGEDNYNSFPQESPINSLFINDTNYKALKDNCIIEYTFSDTDGITVRDSSGNQNNGIIVGDYGLLKVAENVPMGLGSSVKKPRIDEKNDGVL